MTNLRFAALIATIIMAASCIRKSHSGDSATKSKPAALDRCVALRGNGTHAIAHLSAMARITRDWGEIQATAGGSSSTLSTFLYESVLLNPSVDRLSGHDRSDAIALLLKSITGYAMTALESPEWKSVAGTVHLANELAARPEMLPGALADKRNAEMILAALSNNDIRALVNPEVIKNLSNAIESGDAGLVKQHVGEVRAAVSALTRLDASNSDVFVREGILNFPHLIEMIGRVADFYAGIDGDEKVFAEFINGCAGPARDKLWPDVASHRAGQRTCGETFSKMIETWRTARVSKPSVRLTETPGRRLPNIMITSVIRGEGGVAKLKTYADSWRKNAPRKLDISFDEVEFGYWVSPGFSTNPVATLKATFPGAKSRKAVELGAANTWREILEKSPREPSLGSFTSFGPGEPAAGAVSLGGWADLHPVDVLKAGGCKNVVYLTRRTDETSFVTAGKPFSGRAVFGIAELLGLDPAENEALYDLDNPASAFSRSLGSADGVWCTRWNDFSATQQMEISNDAWSAPMIAKNGSLQGWPEATNATFKIRGCTPGAPR